MSLGKAFIEIAADTEGFETDVKKAAEGAATNVGKSMTTAGKKLTKSVTLPIVGAGLGILKLAGDFESSMQNVKAVTGATGDDFTALQDTAKELGRSTVFSASEAAEGMQYLGMAGFDTDEIISAMPGTLALAAATATDLGTAADISSNILTAFGLEAEEAGRMADVLAYGAANSNTDLEQLGDAMTYVGPVAAGLGVSFEEATAAVGILSDAGIQGSMAGTTLRQSLAKLANPTGNAASALETLGVETLNSSGELRPMADIIDDLGDAGASTGDLLEIFGQRAGPGMQVLVDKGGDALRDFTGELEDSGGTAQEMADTQLEGLNGSLKLLMSAVEGLAISIAESGLLEFVTDIIDKFAGWVQELGETNPALLKMLTVGAALLAALGPILFIVGSLITNFALFQASLTITGFSFRAAATGAWSFTAALLANPITWIVVGIAALVTALVLFFTKTEMGKAIIEAVWGAIKSAIGWVIDWFTETAVPAFIAAWDWIKDTAAAVGEWFSGTLLPIFQAVWDGIVAGAEWLWGILETVWDGIKAGWDFLVEAFNAAWENVLKPVWDAVVTVAQALWDFLKPIFEFIWNAWKTMAGFVFDIWKNVLLLAWDLMSAAITALWNSVLKPIFEFIAKYWLVMAQGVKDQWNNTLKPAWNAVKAAAKFMWEKVLKPAFESILRKWDDIVTGIKAVWNSVLKPVWDAVSAAASWLWNKALRPAFDSITSAWSTMIQSIKNLWNNTLKPIWTTISNFVTNTLVAGIEGGIAKIDSAWRTVANIFREPINFVIRTVWNDGIKAAFDNVADAVGSNASLPRASTIPRFADGGPMAGGWKLVGEEGPELIDTGPGYAYTAQQTQRLLNDPSKNPLQDFSETDPPHGGVVSWLKDASATVGGVVRDATGAVVDWARGGLADLADLVLSPPFDAMQSGLSSLGSMGQMGGDTMVKAKDELVDWIRGKDDEVGKWEGMDTKGRSLTGARPHVNAAAFAIADAIQPGMFMQAFNSSMKGQHAMGAAVDFMAPNNKLQATADYMVAHHNRLNGLYEVIYNYKRWTKGNGWAPLRGGMGNDPGHVWHVHGGWPVSYDTGGMLGAGMAGMNYSSKPEAVLTNSQWMDFSNLVSSLDGGRLKVDLSKRPEAAPAPVAETARGANQWDREPMDYLAEKIAEKLWPMARTTDQVNDFARMGQTRRRMGVV